MKVKNLLNEEAQQILSEDSMQAIETALAEKVKLTVEAALLEQDELYAGKLEKLLKSLDRDHSNKLKRLVEAIDKDHSKKLHKVVSRYENSLGSEARGFKKTLVESISAYIEEYIDEAIPREQISEAVKNRTSREVLKSLRGVLAVNSALMKESVKSAVIDGKEQLDELSSKVDTLVKENAQLKTQYLKTKSALILESKVANLSDKKRAYIKRVLGDKTPSFIEENFDYTLRLFDKSEREKISALKEEAFDNRKVQSDAHSVLTEGADTAGQKAPKHSNPYVAELNRIR